MPTDTDTPLMDRITAQRARVVEAQEERDRHNEVVHAATRELAELLAATRDDPDPDVNIASAARSMGVTKGYAHSLVKKLDAGKL